MERIGVNALHAINTIPYNIVFPLQRSPLNAVSGGGVSGGPSFPLALRYNRELRQKVHLLLIMGCGVTCADDVQRYFDLGADPGQPVHPGPPEPSAAARIVLKFKG